MPPSPIALVRAARAVRRSRRTPSPKAMFLNSFLRHPGAIGSVIPSSQALVGRMLAPIDWAKVGTFVEYGPGVGPFCQQVLDRLRPDASYVAIDADADFVRYLRATFRDPRLQIVHGSAADVAAILNDHGLDTADYVLSGIPFSTLPAGVGEAIVQATHDILAPGGAFMAYQMSIRVGQLLRPVFPRIETAMAWRNFPPARLYWAWKDPA